MPGNRGEVMARNMPFGIVRRTMDGKTHAESKQQPTSLERQMLFYPLWLMTQPEYLMWITGLHLC